MGLDGPLCYTEIMFRGLEKYRVVYPHLWRTYGGSWLVRLSFAMKLAAQICKLIILPVATSLIIARLSSHDYDGAYQAVMIFVAASLTMGILSPVIKYIGMRGENPIYARVTADYFTKLVTTDIDYFNDNLAGYLTTATRQYVDSGIQLVRSLRETYMPVVLSIIFPLMVILWFDVWLGMITLILSALQAVYLFWASHAITPLRTKSREFYKRHSGYMADVISNILAVRSTAQEKRHIERVQQNAVHEAHIFRQRYVLQAKLVAVREVITVTFFMILLWLTVERVVSGEIDIVVAVLVATYTMTIMTGVYELSDAVDEHDDYIDKLLPAFEILERQNAIADPARPLPLPKVKGKIVFDHVSFGYEKDHAVFHDFTLHIPAGQKIGIVGVSGAGKSTLTKLLLRFNDVEAGEVLLDGIDIRRLRQFDLRQAMAYVPQEPLLLHSSIKENVLLGRPDASVAEVERALKKAHAWHFVERLPEGIDSIVGERGVKLSGGQKQRVAIARAVLRGSPIMILDEATSALDSESEQIIKDSFAEILRGKTAIVIAHRLSTLSEMDRIVVIDKGRVVEDGTHEQLLARDSTYARLWRRQLKHLDE